MPNRRRSASRWNRENLASRLRFAMNDLAYRFRTFDRTAWTPYVQALFVAGGLFLLLNGGFFLSHAKFLWWEVFAPSRPVTIFEKEVERIEPNDLEYPRLGIKAPIRYVEERNEAVFQTALADGVVHFPGTALPGQPGNVYIFGHSSDFAFSKGSYKTVFALLTQAEEGDEIVISDMDGVPYRYLVKETRVIAKDDTSVLDQFEYTKKLLTLQTSYPIGTALKRFIVIAELAED